MKNFDDPDLADVEEPAPGPRVELIGDPTAISKAFHDKVATSVVGDISRISEQFRAAGIYAPKGALMASDVLRDAREKMVTTQMSDSFRKALIGSSARTAALEQAVHGLRATSPPKLDLGELVTAPVARPTLPAPVRPIVDVRLEQLNETVERLIDVAEKQAAATIAMEAASEARHAESESRADERAANENNLAMWAIAIAAATFWLVIVLELFR